MKRFLKLFALVLALAAAVQTIESFINEKVAYASIGDHPGP